MKAICINYKVSICLLLNFVLVGLCALCIFSFMNDNTDFKYQLINSKINLLILVFNMPALMINLSNAYFIITASKSPAIKGLLLFLNFVLLFVNLLFIHAALVLNTIY